MTSGIDPNNPNRPESHVQPLSDPEPSTKPPSPIEHPCEEDQAPHLGTFVVDIYVPEVVDGEKLDFTELPRHMGIKGGFALILWRILCSINDHGGIETGGRVWVGREH